MTLEELKAEVVTKTGRADLADTRILSAIQAATLRAHQSDFYSKDLYETVIVAEAAAYIHQFDYIQIFSNFRAFSYLRKISTSGEAGGFIEVITPREVLNEWGEDRLDVAYVAGRNLNVRSSTLLTKVIAGVYVNPIVSAASYSSWIADLYPWAIIFDAARMVFKGIGKDQEATDAKLLAEEQYQILKTNNVGDVGY